MVEFMEKTKERIITTEVDSSEAGKRLDRLLSKRFTYHSRNQWQNIIKKGGILLNGKPAKGSVKLKVGDEIAFFPENDEPEVDNEYHRIYGDKWLFAVNKSGNLPCHPAGPFFENTLWYELTNKTYEKEQIHFINRIDRETSGIVLIAKNPGTAAAFTESELISLKRYYVVVYGEFPDEIDADGYLYNDHSIPKDHPSKVSKKRIFSFNSPDCESEKCKTFFRRLKVIPVNVSEEVPDVLSLVEAELITGRMHQIRATLCSLGYPVVGDKLYGPDESIFIRFIKDEMTDADRIKLILPRQALHAARLVFRHPETGQELDLSAPMPGDIKRIIPETRN
jgi:RluA family pseudouridine synthase